MDLKKDKFSSDSSLSELSSDEERDTDDLSELSSCDEVSEIAGIHPAEAVRVAANRAEWDKLMGLPRGRTLYCSDSERVQIRGTYFSRLRRKKIDVGE